MSAPDPPTGLANRWQDVVQEFEGYLARLKKERQEIQALAGQSQEDLEAVQREWEAIQDRLRHVRSHPESYSREETLQAFESALAIEPRLAALREAAERMQLRMGEREEQTKLLGHLLAISDEISRRIVPAPRQDGRGIAGAHGGRWLLYSLEAQEHRQQALARRMHDGPAHALTNLMLQAEVCQRLLEHDPAQVSAELERLRQMVHRAFTTVRDYIAELRPMSLDDLGLVPTVKRYLEIVGQRYGVEIGLQLEGEDRRLSRFVESTLYRAVQELVGNALSHAQAPRIQVELALGGDQVSLRVRDDGQGFDVSEVLNRAPGRGTWGLIGLRERVALLGGEVEIESQPGAGTQVSLQVPTNFEIESAA